jgi:hypothetical protein
VRLGLYDARREEAARRSGASGNTDAQAALEGRPTGRGFTGSDGADRARLPASSTSI